MNISVNAKGMRLTYSHRLTGPSQDPYSLETRNVVKGDDVISLISDSLGESESLIINGKKFIVAFYDKRDNEKLHVKDVYKEFELAAGISLQEFDELINEDYFEDPIRF
jgi:hypothetical protein